MGLVLVGQVHISKQIWCFNDDNQPTQTTSTEWL